MRARKGQRTWVLPFCMSYPYRLGGPTVEGGLDLVESSTSRPLPQGPDARETWIVTVPRVLVVAIGMAWSGSVGRGPPAALVTVLWSGGPAACCVGPEAVQDLGVAEPRPKSKRRDRPQSQGSPSTAALPLPRASGADVPRKGFLADALVRRSLLVYFRPVPSPRRRQPLLASA